MEYRTTDVIDEPTSPIMGPPADGLADVAYEYYAGSRFVLGGEYERLWAANGVQARTVSSFYAKSFSGNRRWIGSGVAQLQDDADNEGTFAWIGGAWGWGPDIDLTLRVEFSDGLTGADGIRVSGRADAAVARTTKLRLEGWVYDDSNRVESTSGSMAVAQYLGRRMAMLATARYYRTSVPAVGPDESLSYSLGVNQGLSDTFMLKAVYRWYTDNNDMSAGGPSFGVAWTAARRSLQVLYRNYETSEGTSADTWWVTAMLQF
jgi:hypothetical protein